MSKSFININHRQSVELVNRLEKMSKYDLPVAIRETLNETAFKMKGSKSVRGEIENQAYQEFDYIRSKNLFRAMTGVKKAKGLNIKSMQSEAGIIKKSGKTQIAENLAQQQKGGRVKSGATPLKKTRVSKDIGKKVKNKNYLKGLDPINLTNKKRSKFVSGAFAAKKKDKIILIKTAKGAELIADVKSIKKRKGELDIRLDWLYRLNETGLIDLETKRPFVDRAAMKVNRNIQFEFNKQARKRIAKR